MHLVGFAAIRLIGPTCNAMIPNPATNKKKLGNISVFKTLLSGPAIHPDGGCQDPTRDSNFKLGVGSFARLAGMT